MFGEKTEKQAKEMILEMVSEYYRHFHDKKTIIKMETE